MKRFVWNPEKDAWLKANRGIGFESIVAKLEAGEVLDDVAHHDRGRYAHQNIYVVEVGGYAYFVPYVETERRVFLKTIYPSRKGTKKYLPKGPVQDAPDQGRA